MSIDMSQFHGVFIEESHEHLDTIERLLMALNIDDPDIEELNSIFRAAHSIKGGSGIFGFEALISVTHVMENLFDKARQQQFIFSIDVIDELLRALDVLRSLLGNYNDGVDPDWSAVEQSTKLVEALLDIPEGKQDIEGFGLFNEEYDRDEQNQGYGFYKTPLINDEEDGFGFFTPSQPEFQSETEEKHTELDDTGFGFFEENLSVDETPPTITKKAKPPPPIPAPEHSAKQLNTKPALSEDIIHAKRTSPSKSESTDASSIRVDISKVDNLVNLAGELVITQSMLNLLGADIEGPLAERLQTALAELERNTRELQESIMSIRMLPLSFVFNRFPRVVRDLSHKLNKQVELIIEGGHTEIDKGLIERLVDPLTHLVRNSLDHGIEIPATRLERGKTETGTLTLRAEQKGGNILISVIDDGGGLNRERILTKAQEQGVDLPDSPSDQQIWQLIMSAGFSTAAEVTDVSGRGVGMDVVKRNIESMGGRIEIESNAGEGSTFQIRLPLTLAILDGMSVAVAEQLFIIPLVNIIESVQPTKEQLKNISNQPMLELRDAYWPIVRLHNVMGIDNAKINTDEAILVLIETSKTRFALQIDDLIGQQQVVIKSLEQHYRRVPGIAGATIMGDGSVALILDVESLSTLVTDRQIIKDAI